MNGVDAYRQSVGKWLVLFLWANLAPLALLIFLNGSKFGTAILLLGLLACSAATLVWRSDNIAYPTRLITSLSAVAFAGLFVAAAPIRYVIDVHLYFFAMLAVCATWCCWRSLIACAIFISLHHLILNYTYPTLVFPAASGLDRVLLHAVVVIVEVAGLSLIAYHTTRSLKAVEAALSETSTARAVAMKLAMDQQTIAVREGDAHDAIMANVSEFHDAVGGLFTSIRTAASKLKDTSHTLLATASQSENDASFAESVSSRSATDIDFVSASTRELSVSIGEIGRRMAETARMVQQGTTKTLETNELTSALVDTMSRVEQFVSMIQQIAAQTNLLALNATIEAARAGDAGRGFGVVASEVKDLASATARATTEIEKNVVEIRSVGRLAIEAIGEISTIMKGIQDHAFEIATAVHQQHSVTDEIVDVIGRFTAQLHTLMSHIGMASRSAGEASNSAMIVDHSAEEVMHAGDQLYSEIAEFLQKMMESKTSERKAA